MVVVQVRIVGLGNSVSRRTRNDDTTIMAVVRSSPWTFWKDFRAMEGIRWRELRKKASRSGAVGAGWIYGK